MVFGIPVMISETDVIKRRLAAGDDAGDSLLALLLIPAGGAFEKCSGCEAQKPRTDLKRCSECKDVWYCSVECQRADWQSHRKLCKVYAQARRARNAAK